MSITLPAAAMMNSTICMEVCYDQINKNTRMEKSSEHREVFDQIARFQQTIP